MSRRFPGLPARSRTGDRDLDALLELVGIWKGDRGHALDRVVTLRDFTDGMVRMRNGQITINPSASGQGITPSPLTGFTAHGAFLSIILSWAGTEQVGYSYTEIWRSNLDDLGTASLIATAVAPVYPDYVETDAGYYYWVRAVSVDAIKGPFNAVAGVYAETASSPERVRDALTSETWQASTSYGLFEIVNPSTDYFIGNIKVRFQATAAGTTEAAEPNWASVVTLGATINDGSVTWRAVEAGRAPLVIGTLDGEEVVYLDAAVIADAAIESAKIKELAADKIFAASGTIADALIGAAHIGNAMIADAAITSAKIANAAITNAKIANASIETLHLQDQAVTFPVSTYSAAEIKGSLNSWFTTAQLTVSCTGAPARIDVSLYFFMWASFNSGTAVSGHMRVLRDSTEIWRAVPTVISSSGTQRQYRERLGLTISDSPSAATHTYKFEIRMDVGSSSSGEVEARERFLGYLELKR